MPLQLKGVENFDDFVLVATLFGAHHTRDLHRDRGGSDALDVAFALFSKILRKIIRSRAQNRGWIDAEMVVKIAIFKVDRALFQPRRYLVRARVEAPNLIVADLHI